MHLELIYGIILLSARDTSNCPYLKDLNPGVLYFGQVKFIPVTSSISGDLTMLKQANKTKGNGAGSKAEMRLVKVLQVQDDGLVAEFVDGKGSEKVFLEALPSFVAQKNASPNFMAKSEGDKMHAKFYTALMKPTSNPEHQFRKEIDTISVKVYARNNKKTVEGYGELPVMGIGNGFVIFARGDQQRKDPLDDNITKMIPADRTITGHARIVHDPEAENKVSKEKGSTWLEIVRENGNPESMDALYTQMRDVAAAKTGQNLFLRIVNENQENLATGSYYPGKDSADVEAEIKEMQDMGLTPEQVYTWSIEPRVYLRKEFMTGQGDSASKLERFLRDAQYTYGFDREKTPVEVNVTKVTRGGKERVIPGEGYFMPVAVSQTLYAAPAENGETVWLPGSIRALVPMGSDLKPSRQIYMTPAQRQVAAAISAPGADDAPDAPQNEAPEVPPAAPAAPAADLDFGFGQ